MRSALGELEAACLVEGIELQRPIGEGGSATVFAARWRGREVAVKVLHEGLSLPRPPAFHHGAILEVLAQGRVLGRPYLVSERFPTDLGRLLDGRPLRRSLQRAVLLPLLDAVEHAHARRVVHGDLKPANVLLDPDARPPRVALTDFGQGEAEVQEALETSMRSADLEGAGSGMTTLPYLAPERLRGAPASSASDLYALGVLLFEVFTGRLPIGLELPSELNPRLDRRLDPVLKAALARDPRERPAGVAPLRRELLRVLRWSDAQDAAEPTAMVYIPGGHVVIGDRADPGARPMHEVALAPFYIDRHPVTNREYLAYVAASGNRRPKSWPASGRLPRRLLDLPVSGITWREARAYATWAGKRLPSELEWERAAQGPEHRGYPFGETLDPARVNTDPRALLPVGSRPAGASSEGVHGLAGNGWEWTASPHGAYGTKPARGRDAPRTIRGGFDPGDPRPASAHVRRGLRPDVADVGVTFRCARDAESA